MGCIIRVRVPYILLTIYFIHHDRNKCIRHHAVCNSLYGLLYDQVSRQRRLTHHSSHKFSIMASPERHTKEAPALRYEQPLLAHYFSHHMLCGNSPLIFEHLNIIKYLDTQFLCGKFSYNHYAAECRLVGLQPTTEYKPMFMYEVSINKSPLDCGYMVEESKLKDEHSLHMLYEGAIKIYIVRLKAYNKDHAMDQARAIIKEVIE